jgi:squalene-hopene/tetraprenyl-beta-curcumene cyclase
LWFGNQDRKDESNPVYGTARVLPVGVDFLGQDATQRGCAYLIASQNADGGWGGGPSVTAWLERKSDDPAVPPPSSTRSGPIISSIEETSLAVDALASVLWSQQYGSQRNVPQRNGSQRNQGTESGVEFQRRFSATAGVSATLVEAIIRGVEFLLARIDEDRHHVTWPIGFYFAKLWYHEKLYPLIFSTAALGKFLRASVATGNSDGPR